MTNYFFTSDTHYGHNNIIKYSERPFKHIKEMDETLIANYNSRVRNGDMVYHLGDFAFGNGSKNPEKYFNRLNGQKHLIIGNHDNKKTLKLPWASVNEYKEISINKQRIILFHYAMRVWHHSYRGTWMLYGHSHGTLAENDTLSFDIGIDIWNYYPVSFEEMKNKIEWKQNNPNYFSNLKLNQEEISNMGNCNRELLQRLNNRFISK